MARIKEGLRQSLNQLREISSEIYHEYVPIIEENTDIGSWGTPILENPQVMSEFISSLVLRIAYTQFEIKYFRNPLQMLEGDEIPLGYSGQEIYVNPAKGRKFNIDDFAGLLFKYEADVKVQYLNVNSDLQYVVTVTRAKLKQAFVSWDDLDRFIGALSNSLYNGAYIDEFRLTKNLISSAYMQNAVQVRVVEDILTNPKAFVQMAREMYFNFQMPSPNFNAWAKMGGSGRPIVTWTLPEDVIFILRNDIRAMLDVDIMASAFNISRTELLGRIITVDNFDVYDDDGNKIYDGSKIYGMMADRRWFRIKRQDMYFDEFYNANNRTWQYYLNLTKMYQFSLFSNAVVFASEEPSVTITALNFETPANGNNAVLVGENQTLNLKLTPANGNTPAITYSLSDDTVASIVSSNNNNITLKGLKAGTTTITATSGNVSNTYTLTVEENAEAVSVQSTQPKTTSKTTTK